MIVNNVVTGCIAIFIGYLLGSIPFAYIFTRLASGKDVRKVSGGNVGARNTFRNIGKPAGITTALFDIAKGAAAVFIASRLNNSPILSDFSMVTCFVLAAGLAAVAGHIWPVFLGFRGGNGLATTLGVLFFVMPWEIIIAFGITIILWAFTRNIILSFNLSLFSLPVSAWLLDKSWVFVVFPFLIVALMLSHFGPVIIGEIRQANSSRELFIDLFRRKRKPD
jgi:glycerol-3-phosphate acyltransferase PlsY